MDKHIAEYFGFQSDEEADSFLHYINNECNKENTTYNKICHWYHTANIVEKITANLYLIVYIAICILGASFEWQLVFDALRHLLLK